MRRIGMSRGSAASALALAALAAGCSAILPLTVLGDPDEEATVGESYSYEPLLTGNGAGVASFELSEAPEGMSVSQVGRLTWVPALDDLGEHTVRLVASTPTHSAQQVWTVRVDQGIDLGTTLSPRGHTSSQTDQDFLDHLRLHSPWGRVVAFHANWRDDVASAGEIPELGLVAGIAAESNPFTLAMGFGWADGEGDPDLTSESDPANDSWTNVETRNEYRDMVVEFAETYQPPYLFLGNETNSYAVTHTQAEWLAWVSQLEECIAAIDAVAPDTVVFTSFQLERMKGVGGDLTGWGDTPQWELLDDVAGIPGLDAISFTSYPYFEHASPGEIPDDYYLEIADHWSGPVIFTEIGWLAKGSFPFPGGEQQQADFVTRFFALTGELDLGYVAWLFLHDFDGQAAHPAFQFIGLRGNDGTEVRLADAAWQAEVALRE